MIRALIFDLDGTLFDSGAANIQAYSQAFEQAGLSFDEEHYRKLFGLRFTEMMQAIAPDASEEAKTKVRSMKAEYYEKNLSLIRPNTGLIALLRSCRQHYKTALVTTASRTNVLNLLAHFGLEIDLFDILITGEDVKQGKPSPECYNQAIHKLSVAADECCVFEDSEVGIAAAIQAGTQVVRITL